MPPEPIHSGLIFACGFGGSAAVEIVLVYQYLSNDAELPTRYKTFCFWAFRFLLAIVAGGLAMAYQVQNYIVALHIGAATPLIIKAFAERPPTVQVISEQTNGNANQIMQAGNATNGNRNSAAMEAAVRRGRKPK